MGVRHKPPGLREVILANNNLISSDGRHQEEDAGNEGGEGQCYGQI